VLDDEREKPLVDVRVMVRSDLDQLNFRNHCRCLLSYGRSRHSVCPIPSRKRPTSKKAVLADWQYQG
jgi:hypothetical protein